MPRMYFSLKQANEMVNRIRNEVERIIQLNEELKMLDETKIEFDDENMESYLLEVELNKNFHEKNVQLYSLIGTLIRQGCMVRDLDKMEIDLYSKLEDKEIILCWQPGEETIKHWHYPNENMDKRKPAKLIEEAYFEKLKKMK